MLEELKKNMNIYKRYIKLFEARSACASISVESGKPNAYVYKGAEPTLGYMECLDYLLGIDCNKEITDLRDTLYKMDKLVDMVTSGSYSNYRTTEAIVIGSNVKRSKPSMIRNDMMYLYKNYDSLWSELDPFLREAYFHITFLHIHPFEDGNGRMARIITSYNFINQNIAPPVLSLDDKREYCDYIENSDYQGLADMMKRLSIQEETVISNLIFFNKKKTR